MKKSSFQHSVKKDKPSSCKSYTEELSVTDITWTRILKHCFQIQFFHSNHTILITSIGLTEGICVIILRVIFVSYRHGNSILCFIQQHFLFFPILRLPLKK